MPDKLLNFLVTRNTDKLPVKPPMTRPEMDKLLNMGMSRGEIMKMIQEENSPEWRQSQRGEAPWKKIQPGDINLKKENK